MNIEISALVMQLFNLQNLFMQCMLPSVTIFIFVLLLVFFKMSQPSVEIIIRLTITSLEMQCMLPYIVNSCGLQWNNDNMNIKFVNQTQHCKLHLDRSTITETKLSHGDSNAFACTMTP